MLELQNISLNIGTEDVPVRLLDGVTFRLKDGGQLVAVLGPSGCGKSTLIKTIAGLKEATSGSALWKGQDLSDKDFEPSEVGYVPQFSIAHEKLEVWECIEDAIRLRCAGVSGDELNARVDVVLSEVGMLEIAEKRVEVLSGGQRRRLALGLELVSSPDLLLCDEVTSGLDPRAEDEITELMRAVALKGRIVLNITHSLRHLASHTSVIVLMRGRLVYHAAPDHLLFYFGVEHAEDLYPRLATRKPEEWAQSWEKRRDSYYDLENGMPSLETHPVDAECEPAGAVGWISQTTVLLARRWRLFWRGCGAGKAATGVDAWVPLSCRDFCVAGITCAPRCS